jgi:thiol-disulfide isomerase/thioredoxin
MSSETSNPGDMKLSYCLSSIYLWCSVCPTHTGGTPQKDIEFVQDYAHMDSIQQFLEGHKGQAVFIDLWATWCEPCLDEFRYSYDLHRFLAGHDINLLYISFDQDGSDSLWRKDVDKFQLSGYHIRANKRLQDNLTMMIWGATDLYSMPCYLLFDKRGVLVDKSLPEPDSGPRLYKQIQERLMHNGEPSNP